MLISDPEPQLDLLMLQWTESNPCQKASEWLNKQHMSSNTSEALRSDGNDPILLTHCTDHWANQHLYEKHGDFKYTKAWPNHPSFETGGHTDQFSASFSHSQTMIEKLLPLSPATYQLNQRQPNEPEIIDVSQSIWRRQLYRLRQHYLPM